MKLSISLSVLLLLCVFIPSESHSQESINYQALIAFDDKDSNSNDFYFYGRKTEDEFRTKGASLWKRSVLLTSTRDTLVTSAMIDIRKDEIRVLIGTTVYTLFQEKVIAIAIDKDVYVKSQYPDRDQFFTAYFKLLSEGSIALLLKNDDTFYYKRPEEPARKVARSKKGMYSIFKEEKERLKKVMRSKNLNPKNNDDLLQIFRLMNQPSS